MLPLRLPLLLLLLVLAPAAGCALTTDEIARAFLDGPLLGEAIFQDVVDTGHTSIELTLSQAPPGAHGVFVLDSDCASDHWDPDARGAHGLHRGDLGNVVVDGAGDGELRITSHRQFTVAEAPAARNVVGRSLMIAGGADDGVTLGDGGAGPALSCAPIEYSD